MLEVLGEHRVRLARRRRSGVGEVDAEFVEEETHEAERALTVEDREKNVWTAGRFCFREEDLPVLARMMQPRERPTLQLHAQLARGDMNRRGQRARRPDVHRTRESVLRPHLSS